MKTAPIPVTVNAPAPVAPKPTPVKRSGLSRAMDADPLMGILDPFTKPKHKTIVPPGLYPGISFAEYQQIEGVNQSAIHEEDSETPSHIFEALNGEPDDPTAAMVLGSALHARLLEMTTSASLIIDGPINDKTGKPYGVDTNAYRDFAALHPDKIILSGNGRAQLDGMAAKVMAHPEAGPLIAAPGDVELAMVWDEPVKLPDGEVRQVRCKGRLDKIVPGLLAIDIKTTTKASAGAWSNAVNDYGYAQQAEFYIRGMAALGIGGTPFGFLVVENTSPYEPVIYEIEPESMAVAKFYNDRALAMIAACQRAGSWPGYPTGVQQIGYPLWKLRRFEEEHQGEQS